jgi:hypothetical protein
LADIATCIQLLTRWVTQDLGRCFDFPGEPPLTDVTKLQRKGNQNQNEPEGLFKIRFPWKIRLKYALIFLCL